MLINRKFVFQSVLYVMLCVAPVVAKPVTTNGVATFAAKVVGAAIPSCYKPGPGTHCQDEGIVIAQPTCVGTLCVFRPLLDGSYEFNCNQTSWESWSDSPYVHRPVPTLVGQKGNVEINDEHETVCIIFKGCGCNIGAGQNNNPPATWVVPCVDSQNTVNGPPTTIFKVVHQYPTGAICVGQCP